MKPLAVTTVLLALAVALAGCPTDEPTTAPQVIEPDALTDFELVHGIGPFTEEVVLAEEIDLELAAEGQGVYEMNCEVCHQWEGRLVGPPLGDVVERRSPTFILNMIMNPEEMVRQHPEGQAMLAQYPIVMPYQNVTEEQAVAILEYIRTQQREMNG